MISLAPLRDCCTNKTRSLALMLAAMTSVSVAGCAFSWGDVTPVGGGIYEVGAQHGLHMKGLTEEKAFNRAEEFCAEQGKQMSFVDERTARDPYGVYVWVR